MHARLENEEERNKEPAGMGAQWGGKLAGKSLDGLTALILVRTASVTNILGID